MSITWRNVDAPDTRGALLGMEAAGQSINTGFDKLGEVLKQREQMATDNWNQQKLNNTNTVMDSMMEAKTPEELQAKEAFLAQMLQGMGAQVDAQAIRAAQDARLPMLQQRAKTGIEYKNFITDEEQAKVRDQVGVLIASGKTEEAMALAQSSGLRQMAPVMAAGNAEQRLRTELGYKANDEARKAKDQEYQDKLFPGQQQLQTQQIDNQKAEAELRRAQAEALPVQNAAAKQEKLDKQLREAQEKAFKEDNLFGEMPKDPVLSLPDHLKLVNDTLGKEDPETAAKVTKYLNKAHLAPYEDVNGNKVQGYGIPTAYLQNALSSTKDTSHFWEGSNRADNIIASLESQMKDPRVASDASIAYEMSARALNPTGQDKPEKATSSGTQVPIDVRPTIAPQREVPAPSVVVPTKQSFMSSVLQGNTSATGMGNMLPTGNPEGKSPLKSLLSGEAAAPTKSVPIASNVGKAPAKVSASETVTVGADGSYAQDAPLEIPKTALGQPTQVVKAYAGAIPKGKGQKIVATFGNIKDGDTVDFPGFTCRLDAIDAPETAKPEYGKPGQPGGEEAKKYLQDMIAGKEVNVLVTGTEKQREKGKAPRKFCQIEIEGVGVDLNMVKAGMGFLYQEYVAADSDRRPGLEAVEKDARDNRRGIFQEKNPEYPEIFRRRINAP